MNKKILIGSIIAVAIILLSSFSSVVGKVSSYNDLVELGEKEESAISIDLLFQLMAKLRNHKELQKFSKNMGSGDNIQDDILSIIEGDDELSSIVEQLSVEDCGCEDDSLALKWGFPIICFFLAYLHVFAFILLVLGINSQLFFIIGDIGESFNCRWA